MRHPPHLATFAAHFSLFNLTPSFVAVRLHSTTKQSWPLHHHCFEGLVAVVRLIVSPLIAKSHGPLASSHLNFHRKEFMCVYECVYIYECISIHIYIYIQYIHMWGVSSNMALKQQTNKKQHSASLV